MMEYTHKEVKKTRQTNRGYIREKELITYSQYMLGSATSEEFTGGVKHLIYKPGPQVFQLTSEPFVVSQGV